MKKRLLVLCMAVIPVFLLVPGCQKVEDISPRSSEYRNTVFFRWNELYLRLDRYAAGYRPAPSARALAYLGLAAYEASVPGMPGYRSIANQLPGLSIPGPDQSQLYHWGLSVNEAYAYLMTRFFFTLEIKNKPLFQEIEQLRKNLESELGDGVPPDVLKRSIDFGRVVGAEIYDWETTDTGGHNAFLDPQPVGYNPPQGLGKWVPTPPDSSRAAFPFWGQVRPFALTVSELLAKPPIPYSELQASLFFFQAQEAFNSVNLIKSSDPALQQDAFALRAVAEFWSDDIDDLTFSNPGHMLSIANQLMVTERLNMAECAELYAKLGLALCDAGTATFYSKYVYNTERPVTYIRRNFPGIFPGAEHWVTALNNPYTNQKGLTPPSPGYPSAHAGYAGAASKILSSIFEFNSAQPGTYLFTDYSHQGRSEFIGQPRTFFSFKDMADECAYSRVALGVNFRMDCAEGLRLGDLAAQRVLELKWKNE